LLVKLYLIEVQSSRLFLLPNTLSTFLLTELAISDILMDLM